MKSKFYYDNIRPIKESSITFEGVDEEKLNLKMNIKNEEIKSNDVGNMFNFSVIYFNICNFLSI